MRLTWFLLVLSIAFSGCADTDHVQRVAGATSPLSRQASAYIGVPQDGSYGSTRYRGSGALAAQAVGAAFAPYVARVTVGLKMEDFDSAYATAKAGGYTYLLYLEILLWEDRATKWSTLPDFVSVKVSIVGTEAKNVLDSAVVGGMSGVWGVGSDHPEQMLPKPLSDYAASLFGK